MELIVVGFHRSGTSLVTQLLHEAGLFVGENLLAARPSNPYGHFEDRSVLRVHKRILGDNGSDWQVSAPREMYISPRRWRRMQTIVQNRQAHYRSWGFKDPRVCLFLGAWKHLLPDARFLVVYRDPSETVRSMHARHSREFLDGEGEFEEHLRFFREPDHGLKLWDTYNRAVVAFAQHHLDDCFVLPYARLTADYPVIAQVNRRFGSDLEEISTETVYDPGVVGHTESNLWVHDPAVADRVHQTWSELERLADRTEPR